MQRFLKRYLSINYNWNGMQNIADIYKNEFIELLNKAINENETTFINSTILHCKRNEMEYPSSLIDSTVKKLSENKEIVLLLNIFNITEKYGKFTPYSTFIAVDVLQRFPEQASLFLEEIYERDIVKLSTPQLLKLLKKTILIDKQMVYYTKLMKFLSNRQFAAYLHTYMDVLLVSDREMYKIKLQSFLISNTLRKHPLFTPYFLIYISNVYKDIKDCVNWEVIRNIYTNYSIEELLRSNLKNFDIFVILRRLNFPAIPVYVLPKAIRIYTDNNCKTQVNKILEKYRNIENIDVISEFIRYYHKYDKSNNCEIFIRKHLKINQTVKDEFFDIFFDILYSKNDLESIKSILESKSREGIISVNIINKLMQLNDLEKRFINVGKYIYRVNKTYAIVENSQNKSFIINFILNRK